MLTPCQSGKAGPVAYESILGANVLGGVWFNQLNQLTATFKLRMLHSIQARLTITRD
jgi:hypothetical protein